MIKTINKILIISVFVFLFISCKGPDLMPPEVSITSHSNGDYIQGTVELSGTATDNREIKAIEVSIDNGETFDNASGTTDWTYSLDTTNLVDGNVRKPLVIRLIQSYTIEEFL